MEISVSDNPEEAQELVEEAIQNVENYAGERPEAEFVKFGTFYPRKYATSGIADPISTGVYLDDIPYDLDDDSTILEHELTHLLHFASVMEELDEEYLSELGSNIDELEKVIKDGEHRMILGFYGHGDIDGCVNAANYALLAALNNENVDSENLKQKIRDIEELALDEEYRHNRRNRDEEISHQRSIKLQNEAKELFVYAINEEAQNLLDEASETQSFDEIQQECRYLGTKEFEIEVETNAKMVQFFERTDMLDKNPYESELEPDELSYIGERLESARKHYRYGDEIVEHLIESLETFYRLKEVYKQAGIEDPSQKAAENVVQSGIQRLEEL